MTAYLLVFGVLALYLIFDGIRRKLGVVTVAWAIGALVLGPVILPIYFTKRPLKTGETREGGLAWNILKNFALFWTVFMVVVAISSIVSAGSVSTNSDAEAAGAAIGITLVLLIEAVVWFFPMVGAIVLGFFLKKSSIIEQGPTGRLAQEARVA